MNKVSRGHCTIVKLTLGKNVRVTNCLYSRKGMPWLRFSSLVKSVMSVCSSAKPEMTRQKKTHTDGELPIESAKGEV